MFDILIGWSRMVDSGRVGTVRKLCNKLDSLGKLDDLCCRLAFGGVRR